MATPTAKRRRTQAPNPEPVPPANPRPGLSDEPAADSYLRHLDPRLLRTHPADLRAELRDLTDLKASIAVHGVVQALTVIPDDDPPTVLMGHHRRAAAIEVMAEGNWPAHLPEAVPCLVRPDLVGVPVDQLAQMLVENDDDQRRGLKPSERAAGYAQLAAFDLDPAEIARRTGKTATHVTATLKLNDVTAPVRDHVDAGLLTLEDMAALEEFSTEPKAMARILTGAGTSWGIKHGISTERRKRADAKEVEKVRAELTAGGVTVVGKPKDWPYGCAATRISDLRDADGNRLNPDEIKTRDGFAAFIDRNPPAAVFICLDPAAHSYTRTSHTSYRSDAQRAAEQAAKAEREVQLAALQDARRVRQRFLADTYGTAKAAKVLFVDALRTAVQDPRSLDTDDDELVKALAGGGLHGTAEAKLDRLTRLLVATWVAAQEDNLAAAAQRIAWQRPDSGRALAWLDRLVAAGYELSDAEADLRTELTDQSTQDSTTDDESLSDNDTDDAAGDTAGSDPAFVLMYGPADGWVLLDDHTGDAVDTWVADPDQLTDAQHWATNILANRHATVTGWQEIPDPEHDPQSRHYFAQTTTATNDAADTKPANTTHTETRPAAES